MMIGIGTISLYYNSLHWTSFYFLRFNQQKLVGIVSTDNVQRTYSEQIHKPS